MAELTQRKQAARRSSGGSGDTGKQMGRAGRRESAVEERPNYRVMLLLCVAFRIANALAVRGKAQE